MDPNVTIDLGPTVEINVSWQGATSTLVVPLSARIIEVKLLIAEMLIIPYAADRQELSWEGNFLKDERTVQSYDIPANATIRVYNKVKVGIYVMNNKYREVVLYDGTTVGGLKAKIHADLGVDIKDKVLRKENYDLDDRTSLHFAGISEGTILHLVTK